MSEIQMQLVDSFLVDADQEEPRIVKYLAELDETGRRNLAGVLGRFVKDGSPSMKAGERLSVYRILNRLRIPDGTALAHVNQVLDYLDFNANAHIEDDELEMTLRVFELFAHAESDNETLSDRELQMLYAVLRHLDADDSHVLEKHEREDLVAGLENPGVFMAQQREENPLLKKILNGE